MRFFTAIYLIILFCHSFAQDVELNLSVPGCVKAHSEVIFISTTELTNESYLEFLKDVQDGTMLPDTTVWRQKNSYLEPYVEYYLRHPAYAKFPVVGISKNHARAYCKWLSKKLSANLSASKDSKILEVIVRIPTKSEWRRAATAGNVHYQYPWEGYHLRQQEGKSKGAPRANCRVHKGDYMGQEFANADRADITAPVLSYWPNALGLYNCAGNVAEMVADEARAYGGSWKSRGSEIKTTSYIDFNKPSSEIGLRYVVEVVRLKPKKAKKPLQLNKKFVKENISRVNDSLWILKMEVTNELYNLYAAESKKDVNVPSKRDSAWLDYIVEDDFYYKNYSRHITFNNYPVVGVTNAEALDFSKWLGNKLQEFFPTMIKGDLPTEQEWENSASGGFDLNVYPWGGPYIRNSRGGFLANFRYLPMAFNTGANIDEYSFPYNDTLYGTDLDGGKYILPSKSYHENSLGCYNFSGNVAEWIKDENFTKGGSWNNSEYYLQISSRFYPKEKVNCYTGFRVVFREL